MYTMWLAKMKNLMFVDLGHTLPVKENKVFFLLFLTVASTGETSKFTTKNMTDQIHMCKKDTSVSIP